jgi:hypothetical protein
MVRSLVGASPLRPGRTSARDGPWLYGAQAFSCAALSPLLIGGLWPAGPGQGELLHSSGPSLTCRGVTTNGPNTGR